MEHEGSIQKEIPTPQYVDEAETLLGEPFFPDQERADALYYDFAQLESADIQSRKPAYMQCLRIMAMARSQARSFDRRLANYPGTQVWNTEWAQKNLTVRRLGAMGTAYHADRDAAVEALQSAYTQEERADELDEDQLLYVSDILRELNEPPRAIRRKDREGELQTYHVRGVIAEATTGFGKTPLMAEVAFRRGIGTAGSDGERQRMLIVAPSVQLVNQLAGITGDRTFERFAHGLTITGCHGDMQNLEGDVIAVTADQFIAYFRNGRFMDIPINLLGFDETHHITRPLVEETFLQEWHGPTLGVTATTGYDSYKDARQILPRLVSHVDALDSIKAGRTNGAQIFMIRVDCDDLRTADMTMRKRREEAKRRRDAAIIEFLKPLWELGKRSMSFCDAGHNASSAIAMASRISDITLDNGKVMRAEALHSYYFRGQPPATAIIERYHQRQIDALTTVRTGVESFNAAIDALTFNDITSILLFRQGIGRGTRLSDEHPVTVYGQFTLPPFLYTHRARSQHLSIYEAWGLERVEQGVILQAEERRQHKGHQPPKPQNTPGAVDISIFSERLQASMRSINFKLASEVLLERNERPPEIPETFIPFDTIPRPENTSANAAKRRLDVAGFIWKGIYQEGRHGMQRWYEPNARSFFQENPLPPVATKGARSVYMLAQAFSVSYGRMQRLVAESKTPVFPMMGLSMEAPHVLAEDLPHLEAYMEQELPVRQPGDISIPDLATELEVSKDALYSFGARNGILARYRRDPPNTEPQDQRGLSQLLAKDQADALRSSINKYKRAEPGALTKSMMAEKLGMRGAVPQLLEHLTDEEKSWLTPRWHGNLALYATWDKEQSEQIEARLRKKLQSPIPHHVIMYTATERLFTVQAINVLRRIRGTQDLKKQLEKHNLGFNEKRLRPCLPWSMLEHLENIYTLQPGALAIEYDRLPRDTNDKNPARIAYARYVQGKLMPVELLGFDPEPYLKKFES